MVSQAAIPARLDRPRLRRRTEHRLLAGVAGGIADSLNASVAFIRFFLVLGLFGSPWVIAAYAAAALLLPARDRNRPDWDNLVGAGRLALAFAGPWLVFSGQIAVNQPMEGSPGWSVASFGLLAVAAAVMLSADYRRGRGRTHEEARATVLAALPVALCALLVATGIALVPDVRWERFVPLVAAAGGVAVVVGGRREYVAPALLALAATAVVVASGARLDGGIGDLRLQPQDPGGPVVVRRAVGDVEIDLRRLRNGTRPVEVEASVGIGSLEVTVPRGANVEVAAGVGRGEVSTFRVVGGESWQQGFDRRVEGASRGNPGGARIRIDAEVGSGRIDISRFAG